jgi:hypothetical protein
MTRSYATDATLDAVLADSFPASDPPSWTQGTATPGIAHTRAIGSPGTGSTILSVLAAVGLVMLVPVYVVALPLVLLWRLLLDTVVWRDRTALESSPAPSLTT